MAKLLACPLCRTDLDRPGIELSFDGEGGPQCPECGASLAKYVGFKSHAEGYANLARDLISRGALDKARQILAAIPKVISDREFEIAHLHALLALKEGDIDRAQELCDGMAGPVKGILDQEISAAREYTSKARELYNFALSAARVGELDRAAGYLAQAVWLDAGNPGIWRLKLKVDLKSGRFGSCYDDLSALDRLSARPIEFAGLEYKLPPR